MMSLPMAPERLSREGSRDLYPQVLAAFEEVGVRAGSVTRPEELDELLRLVGTRICELLEVHRFGVYLREEDGLFHGRVGHSRSGPLDREIRKLVFGRDGHTSEIVATAAPVLVRNACDDPRTVQETMRRWRVRDLLGVPLVVDGEVIGIIYADDGGNDVSYGARDLHAAQLFAGFAALAVRQASLYSKLHGHALIIDRQRKLLEQASAAHKRLTDSAVRGADLDETLRVVCDLVGKPVIFLDESCQPARCLTPPGVDEATVLISFDRRRAAAACARAKAGGQTIIPATAHSGLTQRLLICPVPGDVTPLGYVAVPELPTIIRPIDVKIVEQGATLLSLLLIRERRQADAEGQQREELLIELLHSSRRRKGLAAEALRFGFDLVEPHVLVRVALGDDCPGPALRRRRLLARTLGAALDLNEPLTAGIPGADMLLVPVPPGAEAARVRVALDEALAGLRDAITPRGVAMSQALTDLADYADAHRSLRELIEAFPAGVGPARVLLTSELGATGLALSGSRTDCLRFARGLLDPLRRYDSANKSDLLPTLRAYLANGAQIRATARALDVHENTVRYRLSRIAEESAIDPDSLDSLLDARFALQIVDVTA